MRVLALAKYSSRAASTRQRLLQYAPYLAENGIELDVRPLLGDRYLAALMQGAPPSRVGILHAYIRRIGELLATRQYDAVWVQYELFPYLPLLDRLFATIAAAPIIYDIDDAIFHMYDRHRRGIVRRLMGQKLRPLMRNAAICLCGNPYLRDYVEASGGRAVIVPTVVDSDVFRPADAPVHEALTIGWIGSPSTWRYVEPMLPTLLPQLAALGARFRVVGAGPAARGIEGIDAVDWSEEGEVRELQSMDIGLMPVPDDPWGRGKCGYKLIQYMACGIPSIASPVGVNSVIIDHGKDGFLATNEDTWREALVTLASDNELRRRMGVAGRRRIVANYSLKSQQPVVLKAFRNAAGWNDTLGEVTT